MKVLCFSYLQWIQLNAYTFHMTLFINVGWVQMFENAFAGIKKLYTFLQFMSNDLKFKSWSHMLKSIQWY